MKFAFQRAIFTSLRAHLVETLHKKAALMYDATGVSSAEVEKCELKGEGERVWGGRGCTRKKSNASLRLLRFFPIIFHRQYSKRHAGAFIKRLCVFAEKKVFFFSIVTSQQEDKQFLWQFHFVFSGREERHYGKSVGIFMYTSYMAKWFEQFVRSGSGS